MDKLRRKYLYLTSLLASSYSQKIVIFILLGLILIGFGVLAYKIDLFSSGDTVEVLTPTTEPQNNNQIIVEINGSVERSGVYSFKDGSRVDDLLIASGGLSVSADREWVNKNINRASKLIDGQKIYIYSQSEVESAKESGGIKVDQLVLGSSNENFSKLININTASQSELEKLNGIGPVYAQKIIEGRNYSTTEELVNKKIIPQKTYEKIKNYVAIY